jgi:hypothetical protein
LQPLAWDLDEYRREAETFLEEIDREYYLHLAGHKPDLAVEAIYERHEDLFGRDAVDRVGEARRRCEGARQRDPFDGDEDGTRLRYLHQFALDGHLGALTRELEARTAELEASLEIERTVGAPLAELRRSDLARFFRASHLDGLFPSDRMVPALRQTLAGLGIDLDAQANVTLDTEARPTKSPRAFCSTPRVPEEVYLVMPPIGGREDYAALFHEAGHAEHYGSTDAGLAFEFRHLGDNSVTESFAFLLEGLTASPEWLEAMMRGRSEAEPRSDPFRDWEGAQAAIEHARAARLVMLRRYSAKIAYEVELHAAGADLDAMPARYSELLGDRIGVPWPRETWLSDVDPGFYVACYLRAWALEVDWRRELVTRFEDAWFADRDAGDWLRGLWAQGQRLDADRLLAGATGGSLDFGRVASDLTAV